MYKGSCLAGAADSAGEAGAAGPVPDPTKVSCTLRHCRKSAGRIKYTLGMCECSTFLLPLFPKKGRGKGTEDGDL